jgi:hypothetical protein
MPDGLVYAHIAVFTHALERQGAKLVVGVGGACIAQDGELRGEQVLIGKVIERRQQLPFGKVAGPTSKTGCSIRFMLVAPRPGGGERARL